MVSDTDTGEFQRKGAKAQREFFAIKPVIAQKAVVTSPRRGLN
jgi:hypothetical protein